MPLRDLAQSAPPAGLKLSFLLLAAQVFALVASGLVVINMLVRRLISVLQLASNLLSTSLHAQQIGGLLAQPGVHSSSVSVLLRSLGRQLTGLLGLIALKPAVECKLPSDGRFMSI